MPKKEMCFCSHYHYRPQRSWAKVISLQASVCPHGGGYLLRSGGCLVWGGAWQTPPRDQTPPCGPGAPLGPDTPPQTRCTPLTPPGTRHPPRPDTPPGTRPPQTRHPPDQTPPGPGALPPGSSRLRNTVYERPVRILLECILVQYKRTLNKNL